MFPLEVPGDELLENRKPRRRQKSRKKRPSLPTTNRPLILGYSRTSSKTSKESSIGRQDDGIQEYSRREVLPLDKMLYDRATSGRLFTRTGSDELIRLCQLHPGSTVIVERVDRLMRGMGAMWYIFGQLLPYGTKIHDTRGPLDDLRLFMEGYSASNDVEKSQSRSQIHLLRAMLGGAFRAKSPYGYVKERVGQLAIDPMSAPIVQMIFEAYADCGNATAVRKMLNKKGIPSPTGGLWADTLTKLMRNPIYNGRTVYEVEEVSEAYRQEAVHSVWNTATVDEDGTMHISVDTPHTKIISDELWAGVQGLLDRHPEQRATKTKFDYLTKAKMFCSCKELIGINNAMLFDRVLSCSGRRNGREDCEVTQRYSLRQLEQFVLDGFLDVLDVDVPNFGDLALEKLRDEWDQKHVRRGALKSEIAALHKELDDRMRVVFADQRVDNHRVAYMSKLHDKIDELETALKEIPSPEMPPKPRFALPLPTLRSVFQKIRASTPFRPDPEDINEVTMFTQLKERVARCEVVDGADSYEWVITYDFSQDFGLPKGQAIFQRRFTVKRDHWTDALALREEIARDPVLRGEAELTDEEYRELKSVPGLLDISPVPLKDLRRLLSAFCISALTGVPFAKSALRYEVDPALMELFVRRARTSVVMKLMTECLNGLRGTDAFNQRKLYNRGIDALSIHHKLMKARHPIMRLPHVNPKADRSPELTDEEWRVVSPALVLPKRADGHIVRVAIGVLLTSVRTHESVSELQRRRQAEKLDYFGSTAISRRTRDLLSSGNLDRMVEALLLHHGIVAAGETIKFPKVKRTCGTRPPRKQKDEA